MGGGALYEVGLLKSRVNGVAPSIVHKALGLGPGDLTCLEDCPDVCVQNRGKWVLFWPQGRE